MKKIRLTLFVSFFICYAFSCLGQQDMRNDDLCKVIEKQYTSCRRDCFILEHLDTWYFVSVVHENYIGIGSGEIAALQRQGRTREQVFSSISHENVISFFVRNGIKRYPECTFSTKGIRNYGELTPIYETLKKNKKTFYDMPLIGTFQASGRVDPYAYVFAKNIKGPNGNEPKTDNTHDSTVSASHEKDSIESIAKKPITNANTSDNSVGNSNTTASDKTVTLVVYGTAESEDEAIKIALRSAIEQAFGTFVSANTQIVNDELTKDEIVSVTSGNIERYSLISSEKDNYGKTSVTVKATVSIGKLLHFAQSKGATTELAGATFAMNMKMRRLNKENEYQAVCHMLDEMLIISELNLFDYSIKIGEPKKADDELYGLPTRIFVTPNENYNNIVSIFQTTISALSMSETEQKDYSKTNEKYYKYDENYKPGYGEFLDEANGFMNSKGWLINNFPFVLRNNIESFRSKLEQLRNNIWKSSMSFKILDNIGNYSIPIHVIVKNEHSCENTGCDWPIYVERRGTTTYDIYGITSNHSFLGGALCVGGCGFPTIWKPLYYTEDEILIDHVLWPVTYNDPAENTCKWRRNKEMKVRNNINLIFCGGDYKVTALGTRRRDYTLEQSCLDLSYETYPYFIYLFYNEKDISKVSSITIEPTNPKEINTINR